MPSKLSGSYPATSYAATMISVHSVCSLFTRLDMRGGLHPRV
jgi:hypothetical protein